MKKIIFIFLLVAALPMLGADTGEDLIKKKQEASEKTQEASKSTVGKFTSNAIREYVKIRNDDGTFNEQDTGRTLTLDPAIINMSVALRQSLSIESEDTDAVPALEREYFNKLELYKPIFDSPALRALSDAPLILNIDDHDQESAYKSFKEKKKRGGFASPYEVLVSVIHRAITVDHIADFIDLVQLLNIQILLDATIDVYAHYFANEVWREMMYPSSEKSTHMVESLSPEINNAVAQAFLNNHAWVRNYVLQRVPFTRIDDVSSQLVPLADNRLLSLAGRDLQLWDLASPPHLINETDHFSATIEPIFTMAVNQNAQFVLVAMHPGPDFIILRKLNLKDLAVIDEDYPYLVASKGEPERLWFTADGTKIITQTYDDGRLVQDAAMREHVLAHPINFFITNVDSNGMDSQRVEWPTKVVSMAFYPGNPEDSRDAWIVTDGEAPHTVRLWELNGQAIPVHFDYTMKVTALTISADGRWIVSGAFDGSIEIWDVRTGEKLTSAPCIINTGDEGFAPTNAISQLAVNAAANKIIAIAKNGSTHLCTIEKLGNAVLKVSDAGRLLPARSGYNARHDTAVFSSDDKQLITGGLSVGSGPKSTIKIWNMEAIDTMLHILSNLTLQQLLLLDALVRKQVAVGDLPPALQGIYNELPAALRDLFR
jgi:WD40 repeat protein